MNSNKRFRQASNSGSPEPQHPHTQHPHSQQSQHIHPQLPLEFQHPYPQQSQQSQNMHTQHPQQFQHTHTQHTQLLSQSHVHEQGQNVANQPHTEPDIVKNTGDIRAALKQWEDFLVAPVFGTTENMTGRARTDDLLRKIAGQYSWLEQYKGVEYNNPAEPGPSQLRDTHVETADKYNKESIEVDRVAFTPLRKVAAGNMYVGERVKEGKNHENDHLWSLKVEHDTWRIKVILAVQEEMKHRAKQMLT